MSINQNPAVDPSMPKGESGTFLNADRLRLFYRFYPGLDTNDVFVILHGHGEHGGRYEKFVKILKDQNLSIAVFDMRGNGQSEGEDVYINSFEDYLEDTTFFIRFLREHYGVMRKIFLFGQSLGGLVAVHWALRFPNEVKSLILSSPCLGLRLPRLLVILNCFFSRYVPHLLYRNPIYPPHLTRNPEEVIAYKQDKLIKRKMSVRLLDEMLRYMTRLDEMGQFEFSFPVYILIAGVEKVVDSRKTAHFFDRLKAPDKEIKNFPDFYHEVFNECGQEQAFDALKHFISRSRRFSH